MPEGFKVVAVDGGAASGKSSTSKLIADRNNFLHVDTGAHYRSITHAALVAGLDAENNTVLQSFLDRLELKTRVEGRNSIMMVDGLLPNNADIRREAVNKNVSKFAALESVRFKVKAYQRNQVDIARLNGFNGIIMDGRDIGTIILPDADLKVFLYADEETRKKRRMDEGQIDAVGQRDKMDSMRKTAPLVPAEDALRIDNSNLNLNEVVALVESELNCN